jgi:hypothetical protein
VRAPQQVVDGLEFLAQELLSRSTGFTQLVNGSAYEAPPHSMFFSQAGATGRPAHHGTHLAEFAAHWR